MKNPIEEALEISNMTKSLGYSYAKVAAQLGKSPSAVRNLVRLLKLDDEVKKMIIGGSLLKGHGDTLLRLKKDRVQQIHYATMAARFGISVKALRQAISQKNVPQVSDSSSADSKKMERELSDYFAASVEIKGTQKGFIKITFNSLDEFEGILEKTGYYANSNGSWEA